MSFFRRLLGEVSGKSRQRLPTEMALLGASADEVERVRRLPPERQEEAFVAFARGRHACMVDWRAGRDEILEALGPLLTAEERKLLPPPDSIPVDAAPAIACLREALAGAARRLVHLESFGDFSFLVLVPRDRAPEFVAAAGPWLIVDA